MTRRYLPLKSLRAFEAAARHLSFTQAAIELNVTHSAVSQQVKLLEEQLNSPLTGINHVNQPGIMIQQGLLSRPAK